MGMVFALSKNSLIMHGDTLLKSFLNGSNCVITLESGNILVNTY